MSVHDLYMIGVGIGLGLFVWVPLAGRIYKITGQMAIDEIQRQYQKALKRAKGEKHV